MNTKNYPTLHLLDLNSSNSRVIRVPAFVSFKEGNITYITQYTGKRTFFSHQMCVMCMSRGYGRILLFSHLSLYFIIQMSIN
jgi:hypothetical protein